MSYEELSRLVGREFFNAGVRYFAVAAGEEKLLFLEYDESGAAVKYVVAEHPWLEDGDLRWVSGEYLNFCHYFTSGEALLGAARVMHQTCL